MAPSPTHSQKSLEKVKFSPISSVEPTTVTTTSAAAAAASQSNTSTASDQQHHLCRHNDDETIVKENDITIMETFPPPPSTSPLSPPPPPPFKKKKSILIKIVVILIATIVVLAIISSLVAITINMFKEHQGISSKSVPVINKTDISTTISSSTASLSPKSTSQIVTFPKTECLPTDFQCPNGECLPQSSRCNKIYECNDQMDESNCTDCEGFACKSTDVCLWDRMRCDGVLDCHDLSDEIGCPFNPRLHRLCRNGVRIQRSKWCDGLDDCMDYSDEVRCDCSRGEVPCSNTSRGRCIPKSSKCDGYPDCENSSDEEGCANLCQEGEFQCFDLSCIPGKDTCDGKIDCPGEGGEDEQRCVQAEATTNTLQIGSGDSRIPVCSAGWTKEHAVAFCSSQQVRVVRFQFIPAVHSETYAILKPSEVGVGRGHFDISPRCDTGKVVVVECSKPTCGESRIANLRNAIAGGELSPSGKWPWVASLAHLGSPICGAVIINENWALTAFHCVIKHSSKNWSDSSNPPYHFTITFGTTTTSTTDNSTSSQHLRHVVAIHPHPKAIVLSNGGVQWDLALLKLHSPIAYSDTTQPICLPETDRLFSPTSVCFLAGWGLVSEAQHLKPSSLRDSRLRVWPTSQCAADVEVGEAVVDTISTICAGYYFGLPSGCQGDSGGPLMCLDRKSQSLSTNRWSLAGILSRTNSFCGQGQPSAMANRFARVATSTKWIRDTIGDGG